MRSCRWMSIAATVLLATTGAAQAHDSGVMDFFQSVFGGNGGEGPGYAQPAPSAGGSYDEAPPLIVRRHRPKPRVAARPARTPQQTAQDIKTITIYTDHTLVRGDIVMTKKGLRVFNGSRAFPHTDEDFMTLATANRMPPDISKELHAIDAASKIAAR